MDWKATLSRSSVAKSYGKWLLSVMLLFVLAARIFADTPVITVLTNCDAAALRSAIARSQVVRFDCDGVIVLTNSLQVTGEVTIDGSGHQISIDGGGQTRLFLVRTNAILKLQNLTLQDASGTELNPLPPGVEKEERLGGAIFNWGGEVRLDECRFVNNKVVAQYACCQADVRPIPRRGAGGDIYNFGGTLLINGCSFSNSVARASDFMDFGFPAEGGAISSENGRVRIQGGRFDNCRAIPGDDTSVWNQFGSNPAGKSRGGAICSLSGNLELDRVDFIGNASPTRHGFRNYKGSGGAIFNGGTLVARRCYFERNVMPLTEPRGAAVCNEASMDLKDCHFFNHEVISDGWKSSFDDQRGGAVFCEGASTFSGCTFEKNSCLGAGYDYGRGAFTHNAYGGAIYTTTNIAVLNCSFYQNSATGGSYLGRTRANGFGGAIYSSGGLTTIDFCTFLDNSVGGKTPTLTNFPGFGSVIAAGTNGLVTLRNSILASSAVATNATMLDGVIQDQGYNLSSEDPIQLNALTSQHNVDPQLAPFGFYGGFTPTIALAAGSPAIRHASASNFPPTDQRGVPRPLDGLPDIGAFERGNGMISVVEGRDSLMLIFVGDPARNHELESSSNLREWVSMNSMANGSNGFLFANLSPTNRTQFFRARSN